MKKLFTIVVLVTVAALGVSLLFGKKIVLALSSPETKACVKLGDLCGKGGDKHDDLRSRSHECRRVE